MNNVISEENSIEYVQHLCSALAASTIYNLNVSYKSDNIAKQLILETRYNIQDKLITN